MLWCITIKAAVLQGEIQQAGVGDLGRSEDKHARIKAVGPARVRSSWQLVPLEQLVHIAQDLRRDSVEKFYFMVSFITE